MSDLSDFFAKKDRKKKKSTKAPAPPPRRPETAAVPDVAPPAPPPPQPKVDDGWIELDDPKTAQVNTGGRVVGNFKRDAEETVGKPGDTDAPMEKFTGWSRDGPPVAPEPEPEKPKIRQAWRPSGPDISSGAQFPSLADAANAPQVPQSMRVGSAAAGGARGGAAPPMSGRPRFVNSNPNKFAGLRKLLEDRDGGS